MGRMYTVQFEAVAVSVVQDIFEITPANNKPVLIHAVFLSQSSDVGDAEEELLRVVINRGYGTSGSGGSAPTPRPLSRYDTAAGFAAEVNNTTLATLGSPVTMHAEAFNVRTGWAYIPTPEMRIRCDGTDGITVVRLVAAPIDPVTMSGTMYLEEI